MCVAHQVCFVKIQRLSAAYSINHETCTSWQLSDRSFFYVAFSTSSTQRHFVSNAMPRWIPLFFRDKESKMMLHEIDPN